MSTLQEQTITQQQEQNTICELAHKYKSIFLTKEDYMTFISRWKTYVKNNKPTPVDFMAYTILTGKSIKKAFTKPTNKNKILCNMNGNPLRHISVLFRYWVAYPTPSFPLWNDLNCKLTKDKLLIKIREVFAKTNEFEKIYEGTKSLFDND